MKIIRLKRKMNIYNQKLIECYSVENHLIATVYQNGDHEFTNKSFLSTRELEQILTVAITFDLFYDNLETNRVDLLKIKSEQFNPCKDCDIDMNDCSTCKHRNT